MQYDDYKFKAESLRIFGISLMSPSGIFALNLLVNYNYEYSEFLALRIFVCLILFFIGLICYIKALDIMEQRERVLRKENINVTRVN